MSATMDLWSDFHRYKKFSLYDKLMNYFRIAGKQKPVCFVDYSQTVPLPKRHLIYEDVKLFWQNVKLTQKTFDEVLDEIIYDIITKTSNSNKKLAVWYSGGTDSTAILCSIIKNSSAKFQKEKLLIRLTKDSIEEYPLFFEKYIKKLNYEFSVLSDYFNLEYFNVDGVFGDTIFGEHYIPELIEDNYLNSDINWLELPVDKFENILFNVFKNEELASWLYLTMVPLFRKYEAETVFDAFWLQGAAMNLNQLHLMPLLLSYDAEKISKEDFQLTYDNHYHTRVFSDVRMFSYAFSYRKSSESNVFRPRLPSNKYTLEFTKDKEYFDNKKKVSSQIKMYDSTPFSALTFDFDIKKDIIYRI